MFSLKSKVDHIQAFVFKMIRKAILAVFFICISSTLLANAVMPGGYAKMDPNDFKDLQTKLQNSNVQSVMGTKDSSVKVESIESASKQIVAGTNYLIFANVLVDKKPQKCCFKAFQSLPPQQTFKVICANCDRTCECK